jgi:uncharacterized protein (UPF0210 family)
MLKVARTLNAAAVKAVNVDFLGGFSALVEKGMARGDRALIEALPQALTCTQRVCASVNVAATRAGINMDAVLLMGRQRSKSGGLTADRDGLACAKLCVFANIPPGHALHGRRLPGHWARPRRSSTSGSAAPAWSAKPSTAMLADNPDLNLGQISEIIKHTAYKVTRVGELIGREVAHQLGIKFGVVDLSLAPTPNVGDSVGEIFQSLGWTTSACPAVQQRWPC